MASDQTKRKFLLYDPKMPGLEYDPKTKDYVDENGVRYYRHQGKFFLKSSQLLQKDDFFYVVQDAKLFELKDKSIITTNQARAQQASLQNKARLDSTFVLPGFPSSAVISGFEGDALSAVTYYNQVRYSYLQEDAIVIDLSHSTEGIFKGVSTQRLEAEMKVYETAVPSQKLFQHFKERTIALMEQKSNLGQATDQDLKVLSVLKDQNGPTNFYDFSVQIGAMKPLLKRTGLDEQDQVLSDQIHNLCLARMNASFAMHYYMDQLGVDGLPKVDVSQYPKGLAHTKITSMIGRRPNKIGETNPRYAYFEKVNPLVQEAVGQTQAFEYIFQCMQSSPRWQDVSAYKSKTTPETNYAQKAAWDYLEPTITMPEYYNDPLDKRVETYRNAQKEGEKKYSKNLAESIRNYYKRNAVLETALSAVSEYEQMMTSHLEKGSKIPYYETNAPVSGASSSLGQEGVDVNQALSAASFSEMGLEVDGQVITAGFDFVSGVTDYFLPIGFVPGVVLFAGASMTVHYAVDKVKEGKIQDGVQCLKKINLEVQQDVSQQRQRLSDIYMHPATKYALIYTRNQLQSKQVRTDAEEKMLQYLTAEIENPEGTTYGDIQFDDSVFEVENPALKGEVQKMKGFYQDLVQVQNETNVYAYAMRMYQNTNVGRENATVFEGFLQTFEQEKNDSRAQKAGVNAEHFSVKAEIVRGSVEGIQDTNWIATHVDGTMKAYESVIGKDPFKPIPEGARRVITSVREEVLRLPIQLEHRKKVMQSLTQKWQGERGVDAQKAASSQIVTSYATKGGRENALFYAYSYEALRNQRLLDLNRRMARGIALSEQEKAEYSILDNKEITSFRDYQTACNKKGIEDVLTASHRLKQREDTSRFVPSARMAYEQVAQVISSIHSMADEQYEFLMAVHNYAQSGNLLKSYITSRGIYELFPSRDERLKEAMQHQSLEQDFLKKQFAAEKDVCRDLLSVLKKAPDFKAVCAKNGWLDEKGNPDLSKAYPVPQAYNPKDVNSEKAFADASEQQVCRLIRAMESYRNEVLKTKEAERKKAAQSQQEEKRASGKDLASPVQEEAASSSMIPLEETASSDGVSVDVASSKAESKVAPMNLKEEITHLLLTGDSQNALFQANIIKKIALNPDLIYQQPNAKTMEKSLLALAVAGGHKEVVSFIFDKAQDDKKRISKRILVESLKVAIEKGDTQMLSLLAKEISPRWREVEMDVYNMLLRQKNPELIEACSPLLQNKKANRTAQSLSEKLAMDPSTQGGMLACLDEVSQGRVQVDRSVQKGVHQNMTRKGREQ